MTLVPTELSSLFSLQGSTPGDTKLVARIRTAMA